MKRAILTLAAMSSACGTAEPLYSVPYDAPTFQTEVVEARWVGEQTRITAGFADSPSLALSEPRFDQHGAPAEQPVAEEPSAEPAVTPDPVAEQPAEPAPVEEPVVEEPAEELPVEEPVVEEPIAEEPTTELAPEPVVEEPVQPPSSTEEEISTEELPAPEPVPTVAPVATVDPVIEEPVEEAVEPTPEPTPAPVVEPTPAPVVEAPAVVEEPVAEPAVEEPAQPVVEPTPEPAPVEEIVQPAPEPAPVVEEPAAPPPAEPTLDCTSGDPESFSIDPAVGGVATSNQYSSFVWVEVSGTAHNNPGNADDALYNYREGDRDLTPTFTSMLGIGEVAYGTCLDYRNPSQRGLNSVMVLAEGEEVLPYSESHSYAFLIDIGANARQFVLGYRDCGFWDNSGQYSVTVTQCHWVP